MGSKPHATPGKLAVLGAATCLLTVSAAHGSIADPSLSELVESADLIVIGTTESVRASAWFVVAAVVVARAIGVPLELAAIAGAAAVAGHWAPVFLRFRGGAGLATGAGAAIALSFIPGAVGLAVALLSLAIVRSSGPAATLGLIAIVVTSLIAGDVWAVPVGTGRLAAMVFGRHLVLHAVSSRRAKKAGDA